MNFDIVLEYGGLGDQLFYTQIPELLKIEYPNSSVNVSFKSNFRSLEVTNFIWKANPFVDSINKEINNPIILPPKVIKSGDNIIAQLTKKAGLNCSSNASPKLYNDVPSLPEFNDKTVVDLNYVSYVGAFSKKKIVKFLFNYKNIIFVNRPHWVSFGESIKVDSISDYASIIISSKNFICLTSGGATLACALNKKAICIYGRGQKDIFHHCKNNEYIEFSHPIVTSIFLNLFLKIRLQFIKIKERLRK